MNTAKTKIVDFRNRGPVLPHECSFYNDKDLEIIDDFCHFGVVFNHIGNVKSFHRYCKCSINIKMRLSGIHLFICILFDMYTFFLQQYMFIL
jgi:hypothetical protein